MEKGIQLITGPMFCGKTSELIRRIRREEIAGRTFQLFKINFDKRYGEGIISHDRDSIKCTSIIDTKELIKRLKKVDLVGIDEIQFFDDKILDFCLEYSLERLIIVTGLNLDFRGEPFKFRDSKKHIGELMPYSQVTSLSAVCTYSENEKICGRDAYFTQRLIDGKPAEYHSPLILVGGKEKYEARCETHSQKPKKPNQGS